MAAGWQAVPASPSTLIHQPTLGLGPPVPRLGGRSLCCPCPAQQLPSPHTGLPGRMRPGQPLPSVCTSSYCLPAAPSSRLLPVPSLLTQPGVLHGVPASGQLSPLLPGRGTFHVCHYIPSAGRAAPSSPAPAPSFPQQTGAFPSPWQDACHCPLGSSRGGKELADRLKARACWRWFDLLQGGSHPAGYSPWDAPQQKHPRELNNGSPRAGAQHGAGLRTPGREAAVTNPVHRLPPAGAVRAGPFGAASVPFPCPAP